MTLVSLLAFALVSTAAAQTPNSQDCLADQLLSTQPDSITVQFNAKIIRLLVTPETEIWRRGVDLQSPTDLVTGENIYVRCAGLPATDGTPIATIIAAVQEGSALDLVPHNIQEVRVCGGHLAGIGTSTISIESDEGICVVHFTPATEFWRGEVSHDPGALQLGDEVYARVIVSYPSQELVADQISSNVAKAEGTILSVRPDQIVVEEEVEDQPPSRTIVLLDSRTKCDGCSLSDLTQGAQILATGLALAPDRFRATYITVENAPTAPSAAPR